MIYYAEKYMIIKKNNNWGDWGFMFNNINNENNLYNSQLNSANNIINLAQIRSALNKSNTTNPYVDKTEISSDAMKLFQKDLDVKKFTEIAISDKEDLSYLQRMQELFKSGVVDVYEDDVLSQLVTNSKLWDDLET